MEDTQYLMGVNYVRPPQLKFNKVKDTKSNKITPESM